MAAKKALSTNKTNPSAIQMEQENNNQSLQSIEENQFLITPAVQAYLQAATSQNTRKAYQSDIRHFIAWGGLLPTTIDTLLRYLQEHAGHLNPRTLKRRLVAIKHWHLLQNMGDPTAHPLIRKTLSGISHIHGTPAHKAPPLSVEQLMLISHYLKSQNTLAAMRDNALLQIGFFGAFRRSELVAIAWRHVRFVPQGVEILIPRSKTDQEGDGSICAIPYGNSTLCPVTALHVWQEKSARSEGLVFRRLQKGNKISSSAISAGSLNKIIKSHAVACQLPQAEYYSGHSLRRGFATTASQKGATFTAIMRQGRWRHEGTVHGYIEESQRFAANAASSILNDVYPE